MIRSLAILLVTISTLSLVGCSNSGGAKETNSSLASEPQVTALMQELGITANQAIGGLGSVLTLAQKKFTPEQFKTLTDAIPSSDKYMGALSDLGISGSDIENAAGLSEALTKLGMTDDQRIKFVPAVSNMAGVGGERVKEMFSGLE
jgi:hypothetical protein